MLKRAWHFVVTTMDIVGHPLHRKRPIQALALYFRSLAAKLLSPTRTIAIPYVEDAVLHWPPGAGSVLICMRYGLGEYADMTFCLHYLRPENLFCDVGANAGTYTVLAARAVGCQVVAAEPVPHIFDLLMQNVYANHVAKQVDARRIGIGRQQSRLYFTASLSSYNHVVERPSTDTIAVDVWPLDDVLAERVPAALKIDVEGFEAEVLAGASKTLADRQLEAVLIEMCDHVKRYGATLEDIAETLRAAGLSGPYWYDPAARTLVPPGEPGARRYNQIFVRDPIAATQRLKESRSYRIHGAAV